MPDLLVERSKRAPLLPQRRRRNDEVLTKWSSNVLNRKSLQLNLQTIRMLAQRLMAPLPDELVHRTVAGLALAT